MKITEKVIHCMMAMQQNKSGAISVISVEVLTGGMLGMV